MQSRSSNTAVLPTSDHDEIVDAQSAPPSGVPCPSCGCPVEPDDKFCPACGTANSVCQARVVPTVTTDIVVAERAPSKTSVQSLRHFRCEQCGAEVAVDPQQRSYVCPFCDSTYVVELTVGQSDREPPEFVIGFAITPEQALEKFKQWITRNNWFNPGDLSLSKIADKQRGVYLPFWSFPMLAESRWSARVGEHWQRTETYTAYEDGKSVTKTRTVTETEWWPLSGRHHRFYAGYLVTGSKGLPQSQALRIMPFNLPALKRYEPYFLAGWICEEYSIDRETAERMCREYYEQQERANITAFLPGDTSANLQVDTNFSNVSSDLCLLPVYILSYRYEEKLYRFLVNGQTGKIAGDKPISWQRIAIAVGIGAAIVLVMVAIVLIASSR